MLCSKILIDSCLIKSIRFTVTTFINSFAGTNVSTTEAGICCHGFLATRYIANFSIGCSTRLRWSSLLHECDISLVIYLNGEFQWVFVDDTVTAVDQIATFGNEAVGGVVLKTCFSTLRIIWKGFEEPLVCDKGLVVSQLCNELQQCVCFAWHN